MVLHPLASPNFALGRGLKIFAIYFTVEKYFGERLKYPYVHPTSMHELKPMIIIKTRERIFEREFFEEEGEMESKPKVRFIQEVPRIRLA